MIKDQIYNEIILNQIGDELWKLREEGVVCPDCQKKYYLCEKYFFREKRAIKHSGKCRACQKL